MFIKGGGAQMALYVITSLIRRRVGGDRKISQYGEMIVTSQPDSEEFAQQLFRESFEKSAFAKDQWKLAGVPLIFEFLLSDMKKWENSISPGSLKKSTPHLRLVKE
jgi:hypothetical protein